MLNKMMNFQVAFGTVLLQFYWVINFGVKREHFIVPYKRGLLRIYLQSVWIEEETNRRVLL